MWELDLKKAEHWRIDAFELWMLEKTLESLLDSKEIKPVNLKEIDPELLKGVILKLKFQYFDHLMKRANALEKIPDAGKDWGQQEKGQQWTGWLDGIADSEQEFAQPPGDSKEQGSLVCCSTWGHKESDII